MARRPLRARVRRVTLVAVMLAAPAAALADEFDVLFDGVMSPEFKNESPAARATALRAIVDSAPELEEARKRAIGDKVSYAVAELGRALLAQGDAVGALQALRDGQTIWGQHSGSSWRATLLYEEAEALDWIGVVDQAEGRFAAALALFDEALVAGETINVGGWFNAHFGSVRHRIRSWRYEDALAELDAFEGAIDWDGITARIGETRVLQNRGTLLALRGIAAAHVDTEERQRLARASFATLIESRSARTEDRLRAYAALIRLDLRADDAAAARSLLERMDGECREAVGFEADVYLTLFMASMRARACAPEERDAATLELSGIVADFLDIRRANPLPGGTAASRYREYRAAVEILVERAAGDELLGLLVRLQSAGRLWDALGRPTPGVANVRAALVGERKGCLVFVRGDRKDRWIALCPSGEVRTFEIPALDSWRGLAARFQELVETAPDRMSPGLRKARPASFRRLATELAGILFPEDLRAELRAWDRVSLVGRDDLAGLSLEALPLGEEPFGCSHAVVEIPSLPVAAALRGRMEAPGEPRRARIVADPRIPADVAQRFGLAAELGLTRASITRALGLPDTATFELFLHEQSTARALRSARGEELLHVVAHGVRDPYRELAILLALTPDGRADDGLLGMEAIRSMRCAPTVLLSVCSGADSPPRSGDAGANHLGGGFLEAGARTVILAPADVRLDAALELGRHFYAAWLRGEPASEALRQARTALRAHAELGDPYHWGQMRVYGSER